VQQCISSVSDFVPVICGPTSIHISLRCIYTSVYVLRVYMLSLSAPVFPLQLHAVPKQKLLSRMLKSKKRLAIWFPARIHTSFWAYLNIIM
jgi:hypothetical protein